jgi:hypothetical protein
MQDVMLLDSTNSTSWFTVNAAQKYINVNSSAVQSLPPWLAMRWPIIRNIR